jgi:hypothetical protein
MKREAKLPLEALIDFHQITCMIFQKTETDVVIAVRISDSSNLY